MSITFFLMLHLATALGAYVQATIGFAMTLVIIAMFGFFEILPIEDFTIVLMLLALPNVFLSLKSRKNILKQLKVTPFIYVIPIGTLTGVYLLYAAADHPLGYKILYFALGLFTIFAVVVLAFSPKPQPKKSPMWVFYIYTIIAALCSGLFSVASPPMVYLLYRQPWSVNGIRNMLLTIFLFTISSRIAVTAWQGKITWELVTLALSLIPTVIVFSFLGRKYRNYINPDYIRKMTIVILGISGVNILYKSYLL